MPLTRNRIRGIRSLAHRKGREELGLFVVEGLRLVRDAADSSFEIPEAFSTSEFDVSHAGGSLMERLRARGAHCQRVSSRELAEIADTVNAQGVLALVRKRDGDADEVIRKLPPPGVIVALDGIADPGNLGSIIRSCDWFGAGGILLGKTSVDLYNPKVVRSTMGGIFHLPVVAGVDLPPAALRAKENGYAVYVADQAADMYESEVRFPGRTCIIFGNEAHGVSDALRPLADARVAIRRSGTGESLNVGVSCGILLAAYRRLYPASAHHT